MNTTIVIPSYNQAEYIPDAIESALEQNCPVVIVDDGSRDESLKIAQEYQSDNVKVVHQVNKGLSSARNTGIMWADTKYILPLDADDILLDGAVKKLEELAEANGADIVSPSFKTFGTTNEEVILMQNPGIKDFREGNRVGYCSLIKREALLECGGYSPKMVWGYEDLHLTYNLLSIGKKLVTTPEILWLYRTKEVSMYSKAKIHHQELMAQIKYDFPNAFG